MSRMGSSLPLLMFSPSLLGSNWLFSPEQGRPGHAFRPFCRLVPGSSGSRQLLIFLLGTSTGCYPHILITPTVDHTCQITSTVYISTHLRFQLHSIKISILRARWRIGLPATGPISANSMAYALTNKSTSRQKIFVITLYKWTCFDYLLRWA